MSPRALTAALFALAACLASSVALFELGLLKFNRPDRREFPIQGIDVSHHQKKIDWPTVASTGEVDFVFMKATEGGDFVDPRFAENYAGAKAVGLPAGAYHFFSFCRPARDQARHFIAVTGRDRDELPPALDLELGGACKRLPSREEARREITDWIALVSRYFGRTPIIYTNYRFYELYLEGSGIDAPIWIRDVVKKPKLPDGRQWRFWQFSDRGRVKGIEGPVDLDAFCCSSLELGVHDTARN